MVEMWGCESANPGIGRESAPSRQGALNQTHPRMAQRSLPLVPGLSRTGIAMMETAICTAFRTHSPWWPFGILSGPLQFQESGFPSICPDRQSHLHLPNIPLSPTVLHPDRLDVHELPDPLCGRFPAVPGNLHTTEWQPRIRCHHSVDEDSARVDAINQAPLLGFVVGPGSAGEPEGRVTGDVDGLVHIGHAERGCHGPEQLLMPCR